MTQGSVDCERDSLPGSSRFRFLLAKREKREPSGIRARAWCKKKQKDLIFLLFFAPCARAYPAWFMR